MARARAIVTGIAEAEAEAVVEGRVPASKGYDKFLVGSGRELRFRGVGGVGGILVGEGERARRG